MKLSCKSLLVRLSALSLGAAALVVAPHADAQIIVAVEDGSTNGTGPAIAAQLNNDTYFNFTATVVNASQVDTTTELAAYDVVVWGDSGTQSNDHTQAMASAWDSAAQNQGLGVVSVGWADYSTMSTGPDATLDLVMPMDASPYHYDFCQSNATINIPNPNNHPVTTGLPTTFTMPTSNFVEYSAQALDSTNAMVLGTVSAASCNPSTPRNAIIVGERGAGRLVYLGPLYMAQTSYNNGDLRAGNPDRLLEQAVAWASGGGSICGNNILEGNEVCDDGNTVDCDGCRADCSAVETGCGDTYVCGNEACDDSNTVDCDGCSGDCSVAETGCGDGVVCGTEQCDDGNTMNGDGCSGTCTNETTAGAGGATATTTTTSGAGGATTSGGTTSGSGGFDDDDTVVDDGGCSCRVAGERSRGGAAGFALLGLLGMALLRRRRA